MATVVLVHGIGQQVLGERTLLAQWVPALSDGLARAGCPAVPDTAMAFYGDLFRPPATSLAVGEPLYSAEDVTPGQELDLLTAWWAHAAEVDEGVAPPNGNTLARTSERAQRALLQLSNSRYFARLGERVMVGDLKQVTTYLSDPRVRAAARARVTALIGPGTRVVVAHSLGSVVAYEALCATPGHGVRALVTLGSPLGIPNHIFHLLDPAPGGSLGAWPGGDLLTWTNIADSGDVVALVKDLRPCFGDRVRNVLVHNGSDAHSVIPYLTEGSTGAAIAAVLG
ncbi:hypothetical protein ACIBO6_30485 [Streptomyces luteogriseus]|uniref:hypothetical protein n=1 Tax=Streptomyces luteogriseus TaxID=68233 RepID=UPI0037A7F843